MDQEKHRVQLRVEKKLRLNALKRTLFSRKFEILILIFFLIFSLRAITWFQPPNVLIGGDYRPPLIQDAFLRRATSTWDETDFGMPSVYAPRILVPSNLFITVFQSLGAPLYTAQMWAIVFMFFFSSTLMYLYTKRLTNGNIVASFIAALFLVSNLFLINDREVTAIGFLDVVLVILPTLFAFTEGIYRKSYTWIAFSGILFSLTYSAFPNFRVAVMCLFALAITLVFILVEKGIKISYHKEQKPKIANASLNVSSLKTGLKYVTVFIVATALASIWILLMIWTNIEVFTRAYEQLGMSELILALRPLDVFRLITKWGFYSGLAGQPYVPYAEMYLQNPVLILLSYLPPIMAFASLFISKARKITVYFSIVAVIFLILSSGFSPYLSQLYITLSTNIPLMLAFRESAHWSLFVILAFSILIGITVSTIQSKTKDIYLKTLAIGLAIAVLIISAYPLTTGDVSRNFMETDVKGAYFPESYSELNNALSDRYWTLSLPQKYTYVVYNFRDIPLGSGNPTPLIFSKPILTGLGSEYMQSNNSKLLDRTFKFFFINEERNIALGSSAVAMLEEGNIIASTMEGEYTPELATDGNLTTRWSSNTGMPQWYQIDWNQTQYLNRMNIYFENAYADNYTIETYNGTTWKTQLEIINNTNTSPQYTFTQNTPATKLRINFTQAQAFNRVSIYEIQIYAYDPDMIAKFTGILGIKQLILEKDLEFGSASNLNDVQTIIDQNYNFVQISEWEEVILYNNTNALQKIYTADNILNFSSIENMLEQVKNTEWKTLTHTAFINPTATNVTIPEKLEATEVLNWTQQSPTSYTANLKSNGTFALVLLQSFDENWKVTINGFPVLERKHFMVNDYANAWIIEDTGELQISIQYETQSLFTTSIIISLILPVVLILYLSRKNIAKTAVTLKQKISSQKTTQKIQKNDVNDF